jgi:uncharacterized protein YbjT (DUF2867 family)
MNDHTRQEPTLVIGGTGKTGRRVAERLQARGLPVRIASRSSDTSFDWEDQSTWEPALRGTSAAYVTYYPDIALPGAPEKIAALADIAVRAGTRRLVLLSGRGEVEAQRAERELAERGVTAEWTVVRCSWFMQNFNESFFAEPIAAGELALPAGDQLVPFVDVDDIADVVVAALTEDGHAGRVYELTGPRALTHAEVVEEISGVTGREIRYQQIPMEVFTSALAGEGVPSDVLGLLEYLFAEVLTPENATVADGVRQALGREPRDFSDFARDAAATGVWDAQPAVA